jgi:PKD repeat protein
MMIGGFTNPILAGGGTVSSMNVDFIASTQSTQIGATISFTNLSDPTPIFNFWEFGDGDFSTASNPDKVYSSFGTFSITLNACDLISGGIETKTDYISIQSVFDPDAFDYINRVETADAQTLEIEIQSAINNLVVELKDEGLWDDITQLVLLSGPRTLSGILVPLKGVTPSNPSNVFVSSDYNRKTGLKGNRSSKWLDTNVANNTLPDDAHVSVFISESVSFNGQAAIGSGTNQFDQPGAKIITIGQDISSGFHRIKAPLDVSATPQPTNFCGLSRTGNTVDRLINTTLSSGLSNTVGTIDITTNVVVFARGSESSRQLYSGARLKHWSLGSSIDLSKLKTALDNYYTEIDAIL